MSPRESCQAFCSNQLGASMCHGIVNLADLDFLIQPLTFDLGRVDHLNDIKSFFLKCNILKLSDRKEAPAVAPSLSVLCLSWSHFGSFNQRNHPVQELGA